MASVSKPICTQKVVVCTPKHTILGTEIIWTKADFLHSHNCLRWKNTALIIIVALHNTSHGKRPEEKKLNIQI